MKIDFLIFAFILIFSFGCKNQSNKIEKVNNSGVEYLPSEHYSWFETNEEVNDSIFIDTPYHIKKISDEYGPKLVNSFFLISKIKITKEASRCVVEGVISNASPFKITNIKIACALTNSKSETRSSAKELNFILNPGCANSFKINLYTGIISKNILYDIQRNIKENTHTDEPIYDYSKVGICIEEFNLHYNQFGSKYDLIDTTFLVEHVINTPNEVAKLFNSNDIRNDGLLNSNEFNLYEADGLGKKERELTEFEKNINKKIIENSYLIQKKKNEKFSGRNSSNN